MRKSKIAVAVFAMVIAVASVAKAEIAVKKMLDIPQYPGINPSSNSEYQFPTEDCCGHKVPSGTCAMICPVVNPAEELEAGTVTMGNLTGTSDKISSIDMDKNIGEAGNILDGFYSGSKTKRESSSSVVYSEPENSQRTPGLTEKEICNAKASKITLIGKVPPLNASSGKTGSEEKGLPVGAGVLAAGAIALAISGKKKSYSDDVDTIIDAAHHPLDTAHDVWNYLTNTDQGTDPYPSGNGQSTPPPLDEVENDAAVTPHNCYPSGHCQQ